MSSVSVLGRIAPRTFVIWTRLRKFMPATYVTQLLTDSAKVLAFPTRFCYAFPWNKHRAGDLSSESSHPSLNCSQPGYVPKANSLRWLSCRQLGVSLRIPLPIILFGPFELHCATFSRSWGLSPRQKRHIAIIEGMLCAFLAVGVFSRHSRATTFTAAAPYVASVMSSL